MSLYRLVVVALITLAGAGCAWLTAPDLVLGTVVEVTAPDTVTVNRSFTVTVTTTGPNGCWRKDHTEVSMDGLVATIAPYDFDEREDDPNTACHQAVVYPEHTVELQFDVSGAATIRVRGAEGTDRELEVAVEP